MKAKSKCCRKYNRKGIACKKCPLAAALGLATCSAKSRKKAAKRLAKAA